MSASLNQKLNNVQWGYYRVGNLFKIENTSSFNTDSLVEGDDFDYVTRTSINQGVLQTTGFVNEENINNSGNWSLGLLQMDFFYRKKPWYAGQFVRKVIPKDIINDKAVPFFTTVLNKLSPILSNVLVRDVNNTFEELKVLLPVKNGELDFDFMESFIAELETERVGELESYLTAEGLKDCELTKEEEAAIRSFNEVEWKEYQMKKLFERINTKKLP
ncbi:MAG: type I restriction endonuclease subunit R, partial [Bacteroidales bacterium]|nr:type I restriction endonuclease subunit R [Bacteroidales bacterium]